MSEPKDTEVIIQELGDEVDEGDQDFADDQTFEESDDLQDQNDDYYDQDEDSLGQSDNLNEDVNENLVDLEQKENSVVASSNGTQTPSLSFEDPRFFQLDAIIGPDQEVQARLQRSNKKLQKQKSLDLTRQNEGREYLTKIRPASYSGGQEEYDIRQRDEEGVPDYSAEIEIPGEVDTETEIPPQEKESLQVFEELYMKLSDACVGEKLSADAAETADEELDSSPSPPGSPQIQHVTAHTSPSIESFFKLAEKVKINFHVLPGKKIYSKDVRLDRNFGQIKEELARLVKVPSKFIELRRNKNLVMDYKTLKDVGGKEGKKMRFSIEINKRALGYWELLIPEEATLPPRPEVVRRVKFHFGKVVKTLTVCIEFARERKLFIGGYRDKIKGTEHHHAATQTQVLKKKLRESQEHKCTQAFRESTGCSQTMITSYTQVDRPDYFVSCQKQKLVHAKAYVTSCRMEFIRQAAAITIQKYWRRWLAIKERYNRMSGLVARLQWAEQVRKGRTETRLAIKDDELYRQYNPSTLLDLELLYRAINSWRKQETDYVLANRWGAEKKAALADIMEKEADLLLDLERAKSQIMSKKNSRLVEDLYKKMGAPTRWLTRTGQFITLDTTDKATVRTHHDLYRQLQQPVKETGGNDERLQLLDKLYKLIKDHRSSTSEYLVQLIGREITLMQRNVRERLLIGLRKRILNAYFTLCRDSTFNPEARTLQKVPYDVMKLRKDMVQCKGCLKMLYRDQFAISHGVTVTNRCLTCMGLYRTCILRVDLNLYRRMLQELREDEQQQGVGSSTAYLIDAYDLQFLIEKLWHGQSALSGIDDRYLLRLCRWLKHKPWTPWNCVLLTEEEAVAHLHIDDMTTAYQHSFFEKVRLRHNAARSYFERTGKTSLGLDTDLQMLCMSKRDSSKLRKKSGKRETKSTTSLASMKVYGS